MKKKPSKRIIKKKAKPVFVKETAVLEENLHGQFAQGQQALGTIKEKIQKGSHVVGQAMQAMGQRLISYAV